MKKLVKTLNTKSFVAVAPEKSRTVIPIDVPPALADCPWITPALEIVKPLNGSGLTVQEYGGDPPAALIPNA
jgi:hypothetical protein